MHQIDRDSRRCLKFRSDEIFRRHSAELHDTIIEAVLIELSEAIVLAFGVRQMGAFHTEKALTEALVRHLRRISNPWGRVRVTREFFYHRGRTDVVALTRDGTILAFEAKLKNWREALHQAYRNSCFAHGTYVVVPKSTALLAHRYSAEFESRHVGLCVVSRNALIVLHEARPSKPLQPWLSGQAAAQAMNQCSP